MPKFKSTIFFVVDVETTKKDGYVFDVGWNAIDKQNRIYSQGSYLAWDVLQKDTIFFRHKIGHYYKMIYKNKIRPLQFATIRKKFNAEVKKLTDQGHRVIFCAYNAGFDITHLGQTSLVFAKNKFLESPLPMMCIWQYWCMYVPKHFQTTPSPSGKYWSTSAESVYAWQTKKEHYEEPHIAFPDTLIESEILLWTLQNKKKMPIVNHPKDLDSHPWKIANARALVLPTPI